MGGKNHQPTNVITLIAPSALLSKRIGLGIIAINEANNFLEDSIICAMDRLHVEELTEIPADSPAGFLRRAKLRLLNSLEIVGKIEEAFDNLLSAAKKEGYTGNPLAPTVSSLDLKTKFTRFIALPSINENAWDDVERRVRSSNVIKTLEWERQQFDMLQMPTRGLVAVLERCEQIATERGSRAMIQAVECNEIDLRQRYGQVFSLWNYLDAMFLYSAFIMTELFYRSNEWAPLTAWVDNSQIVENV